MIVIGFFIGVMVGLAIYWLITNTPTPPYCGPDLTDPSRDAVYTTTTTYSSITDAYHRYVGRLLSDVESQQRANRIKKRKLRALRAEVKRLRKVLNDTYHLDQR